MSMKKTTNKKNITIEEFQFFVEDSGLKFKEKDDIYYDFYSKLFDDTKDIFLRLLELSDFVNNNKDIECESNFDYIPKSGSDLIKIDLRKVDGGMKPQSLISLLYYPKERKICSLW